MREKQSSMEDWKCVSMEGGEQLQVKGGHNSIHKFFAMNMDMMLLVSI